MERVKQAIRPFSKAFKFFWFFKVFIITGCDILTDYYYVFATEYCSESVAYCVFTFLFLLPSSLYLIELIRYYQIGKCNLLWKLELFFGLIIWQFYPIIIAVLPIIVSSTDIGVSNTNSNTYKIMLYQYLIKFQFIFQSIPQLILQGYNNHQLGNWTAYARVSYTFSIISVLHGIYLTTSLFHILNKIKSIEQLEIVIAKELESKENSLELSNSYFFQKLNKKFVSFYYSNDKKPINYNSDQKELIRTKINEFYVHQNIDYYQFSTVKKLLRRWDLLYILVLMSLTAISLLLNLIYVIITPFSNSSLNFSCMLFFSC